MSEGPEVKIVADKILSSMFGKKIEDIIFKNLNIDIKNKIIGSKVKEIKTFGKNIVIKFSIDNPSEKEPIKSLGPDCLNEIFDIDEAKMRLHSKQQLLISEALLDQKIISGIGNKYKSEILFICKISPFKLISQLKPTEEKILLERIPKLLRYGYKNCGRTRCVLQNEKSSWNTRHWVFRRTGKECWICRSLIKSEKTLTNRATFWCPNCQQ